MKKRWGLALLVIVGCADPVRAPSDASAQKDAALDASGGTAPDASTSKSAFGPIQCPEPGFRLKKPLYLGLKSSSRPLARMKKGDEAVVQLEGANGSVVAMDELVLSYEPDSNLQVLGPGTATFRGVAYATQDGDLIRPRLRVRLKGDGGELRIFYSFASGERPKGELAAAEKTLGTVIGFGNLAEDAPRLDRGTLADLVARALEPCVKESMHCFASFLGLKLKVVITFASSGSVQHVEALGVGEPIPTCFKERLARMSIPPFEGGPFTVELPLIMSDQPHALLRVE
jgi:hypothetical protein